MTSDFQQGLKTTNLETCYNDLVFVLNWLKVNKINREQAILVTDLEKVVAYYKMFILDAH